MARARAILEATRRAVLGIQGQVVLGICSVGLAVTLASVTASTVLIGELLQEKLDGESRARSRELAHILVDAVDEPSGSRFVEEARRVSTSHDVVSLGLYDAEGVLEFSHLGRTTAPLPERLAPDLARDILVRTEDEAPDGTPLWTYSVPVARNGGEGATRAAGRTVRVGTLVITLSMEVLTGLRAQIIAVHVSVFFSLLLGALAFALLFGRHIARPIRELAEHAKHASISLSGEPLPLAGAPEVRSLGEVLNQVFASLSASLRRARASEERYRGLFDHIPDVAMELDGSGTIRAVNAAVAQLGLRPDEVIGQPVTLLVAPDAAERIRSAIASVAKGLPIRNLEVPLRPVGCEERFGELRADPGSRQGAAPEEMRLLVMLRDVTERKKAERDVAHAQRVASVHTLATGIAHDFNNILGTIIGTASLVAARQDLPDDVGPELRRIIATGRRGADLSGRILSYARRESGAERACDVPTVVHEVVELLSRTLDKRVTIETHLAAELPTVRGDATGLQQVLLNLGINAGDAMPCGGKLSIRVEPYALRGRQETMRWGIAPGTYAHLTVEDTGVGMDNTVMKRIFEPYFTTKPPGQGTGLGLAIVYGIVNGLGGAVQVNSAPGEGARFEILLPTLQDVAVQDPETPVRLRAVRATRPMTLLVVEDEPDLLHLSETVLKRAGHRVLSAPDGFRAEELARAEGPIDLVLLDVNLPQRDGVETFEILRALRPGLPVVIVSGGGTTDQRITELLRRGALALLRKPYEFKELEEAVARWTA